MDVKTKFTDSFLWKPAQLAILCIFHQLIQYMFSSNKLKNETVVVSIKIIMRTQFIAVFVVVNMIFYKVTPSGLVLCASDDP